MRTRSEVELQLRARQPAHDAEAALRRDGNDAHRGVFLERQPFPRLFLERAEKRLRRKDDALRAPVPAADAAHQKIIAVRAESGKFFAEFFGLSRVGRKRVRERLHRRGETRARGGGADRGFGKIIGRNRVERLLETRPLAENLGFEGLRQLDDARRADFRLPRRADFAHVHAEPGERAEARGGADGERREKRRRSRPNHRAPPSSGDAETGNSSSPHQTSSRVPARAASLGK